MKSALVDFHNLDLRTDLGINNTLNKAERKEIIKFFKTYVPNVVKKLTAERKKQIRDFEFRLSRLMEMFNPEYNPEEMVQALLDNKALSADGHTTLDGYEARHGVSWFDSIHFHRFIMEYRYIKDWIDCYITGEWNEPKDKDIEDILAIDPYEGFHILPYLKDLIDRGRITIGDWKIFQLKERKNWYWRNETVDMELIIKRYKGKFDSWEKYSSLFYYLGICFGELFPSIYDDAISLLERNLPIQRCNAYPTPQYPEGCKKIFFPNKKGRKKEFCSDTCRKRINKFEKEHHEYQIKRLRREL